MWFLLLAHHFGGQTEGVGRIQAHVIHDGNSTNGFSFIALLPLHPLELERHLLSSSRQLYCIRLCDMHLDISISVCVHKRQSMRKNELHFAVPYFTQRTQCTKTISVASGSSHSRWEDIPQQMFCVYAAMFIFLSHHSDKVLKKNLPFEYTLQWKNGAVSLQMQRQINMLTWAELNIFVERNSWCKWRPFLRWKHVAKHLNF